MVTPLSVLLKMDKEDLIEYIATLEAEVQELRAKTDNSHKLSPNQVRQIRGLFDTSLYSYAELAEEFCVNPETIRRTVLGEYHRDVR